MTNPLQAAYYADHALHVRSEVVENVPLARATYRVRVTCPDLAARVLPGQFIMLRLAGLNDPLLGRAFALYDTVTDERDTPIGVDIVYLVVGKLTARLAECKPGDRLELWGPLGNGFPRQTAEHLIMVAGGIGQTPFLALAKEHLGLQTYGTPPREVNRVNKVTLCYGARTAELLAGIEDFERAGVEVHVSTDDGSRGHHGLITAVLDDLLEGDPWATRQIVCCGPEPMMAAVSSGARQRDVPCQVSLETPMACGIGICFSCVARVEQEDGDWDYKRTCVEGPVFDARKIVW